MIKIDNQVSNSNFLNFSIISKKELDLSLLEYKGITFTSYEILGRSSKMSIKIEKINFDVQNREIFTKFYRIL